MLDGRALNCVPINNAPGTVMTMMDPSNVVNVFVAGKLVKHNGNLVGVDVEKLKREVELSSERVLERIMSVPIPVDGLNSAPGYTPSKFGSCCVGDDYDVRP
jgi:hypothetical protein